METILWHDYETTGANPSQDRPVQFAALRTDLDLQPVEDPLTLYCRPAEDCVPSPYACLVTGISPQLAKSKGLNEPEFMQSINSQMLVPGTCSAGYNSIRFDDEVTRYGLYRNFIDPYAREWKNGNSRWDIIDMVRLVHLLRPEALNWPKHEDGSTSFRLESLTFENSIAHADAHDALSDVEATIGLARLIKSSQPKLYEHYWKLRRKNFASQQIDVANHKPFLHISSRFPASRGCAAIMVPLKLLKSNPNAVVALDLSFDNTGFDRLSHEDISRRLFSKAEDLAENEERIPLKLVHLNRSPVILPVAMLVAERANQFAIDLDRCELNWHKLLQQDFNNIDFESLFGEFGVAEQDVEQSLYQGFLSDSDRRLADTVPRLLGDELRLANLPFQDGRLQELLFRYRARNFPESLTSEERAQWHIWVKQKLEKGVPYGQSIDSCLAEIQQLRTGDKTSRDIEILQQLEIWLNGLRSKYAQA